MWSDSFSLWKIGSLRFYNWPSTNHLIEGKNPKTIEVVTISWLTYDAILTEPRKCSTIKVGLSAV